MAALIEAYGESQEIVHYSAAVFPGLDPKVRFFRLSDFVGDERVSGLSEGMLYVPPKGMTYSQMLEDQAFRSRHPYDDFALRAISELREGEIPSGFKHRYCSPALLNAMMELASDVQLRTLYRRDPASFAQRHCGLSPSERSALISLDSEQLRLVTTLYGGSNGRQLAGTTVS